MLVLLEYQHVGIRVVHYRDAIVQDPDEHPHGREDEEKRGRQPHECDDQAHRIVKKVLSGY